MDRIGDFLTIIRNASKAQNELCSAQWSKLCEGISKILKDSGYIHDYQVISDDNGFKRLQVTLKCVQEVPAITNIKRESTPGCRRYCGYNEIPRVLSGLGIAVLTTSQGVKSDRSAKAEKLGGELICTVW